MQEDNHELALAVKRLAKEIGYAACGISGVQPFSEFGRVIEARMAGFPEAAHLYAEMMPRIDPASRNPWTQSLIVCVRRYGKYAIPEGLADYFGRNYLCDRRIPECPDYDMTGRMRDGLKGLGMRVARGGVPDRWAAARAGITRFAKNCFAYSEYGSWINIETWLVDRELPPDREIEEGDRLKTESPCPPGCSACIESCPTGALEGAYTMRMDRCIAYLSYFAPEPIADDLWSRMGSWIYGCDVCQRVCPLNAGKWEELERAAWLEKTVSYLRPEALATMSQATYEEKVFPLFFYIPRDNIARWHRNAKRALELK